jgi:hypothetical protein
LQKKPHNICRSPLAKASGSMTRGVKNWGRQVARALNRSCNELGEEGHVGEEADRIACRPHFAAIDGDGVGERLEGVEADPDRQDHLERRCLQMHAYPGKRTDERGDEEVVVLEETQDAQIHADAEQDQRAAVAGASASVPDRDPPGSH